MVIVAGLCWQDPCLALGLVKDAQRAPPYRNRADLPRHASCRQGGWLQGFHVKCQLEMSDLQVVPFWSKNAKGPATLQGMRWYQMCSCHTLKPFSGFQRENHFVSMD